MFNEGAFLKTNEHSFDNEKNLKSETSVFKLLRESLEGLNHEELFELRDEWIDQLKELQYHLDRDEQHKEMVIELARAIIECSEMIGNEDGEDSERSSGFKKHMKKSMHRKSKGCGACGGGVHGAKTSRHDAPVELHHIIPREYGGEDIRENALIVCRTCHKKIH